MKTPLILASLSVGLAASAQEPDSVTLGAGYVNESYYSFANGEVANVSNINWDLAFDLSAYGATIRMNRKTDVLYLYPGPVTDWATVDTAGHANWDQYTDGYESWEQGALNAPATSAPEDLGWGNYNTITHITEGSRIFVIKLGDDSYRKLLIEQLASGIYTFKYANIDGSDEVTETISKADYAGKNFIHYSILNEQIVDREPASAEWDIVFTNYVVELAPGYFSGVTGTLSNSTFRTLTTAEINNVPVADADYVSADYQAAVNIIGYDWKTFNMGTFTYEIVDSLCYFVKDENDNTWKLVFIGFSGSTTGKIYFTKEQLTFASVPQNTINAMIPFPVPANEVVNIKTNSNALETVMLFNTAGQLVASLSVTEEQTQVTIPVNDLQNGLYILQMVTRDHEIITKKITVQH